MPNPTRQAPNGFIANTDFGWFSHFLHRDEPPDEVDFWQPSPHGFRAIPPGAPRRKKNGAPGGIALKPCGEGCQKSTSSGGSARCRKCENQPKSVLAMKAVVAMEAVIRGPPGHQRVSHLQFSAYHASMAR